MIVTSEMTVLSAMTIAANTGRPTRSSVPDAIAAARSVRPATRPRPMNISTGITIVPTAPIGSRRKILVSSHVSFARPRSTSVPDRMAGEREEHVFERRQHRAEIRHADPVLGHAVDEGRDEVVAAAVNREPESGARHRLDARHLAQPSLRRRVLRGDDHGPL